LAHAPARLEGAANALFEPAWRAIRDGSEPLSVLRATARLGADLLLPWLGVLFVVAVIAGMAQGGLRLR